MANSTWSFEPCLVLTLAWYCSGAMICSRMFPSWISPNTPRVFTLLSTFFRSPTPCARCCISPRPFCTASSRSLTSLNDCPNLSSRVLCSFSSTVSRIFSSFNSVVFTNSSCLRPRASNCCFCIVLNSFTLRVNESWNALRFWVSSSRLVLECWFSISPIWLSLSSIFSLSVSRARVWFTDSCCRASINDCWNRAMLLFSSSRLARNSLCSSLRFSRNSFCISRRMLSVSCAGLDFWFTASR